MAVEYEYRCRVCNDQVLLDDRGYEGTACLDPMCRGRLKRVYQGTFVWPSHKRGH